MDCEEVLLSNRIYRAYQKHDLVMWLLKYLCEYISNVINDNVFAVAD